MWLGGFDSGAFFMTCPPHPLQIPTLRPSLIDATQKWVQGREQALPIGVEPEHARG